MILDCLRKQLEIAKNVSIDYNDMSPAEITSLDNALDTVFKLASEAIFKAENASIFFSLNS